jgi:acetyl esterase/lipase
MKLSAIKADWVGRSVSLFGCLILFSCASVDDRISGHAAVKSNVSYASVTELDFTEADARFVYGDANPDLQYGLLWLPRDITKDQRVPLVVLIHGGCWLNQFDIRHSYALGSALAEAGYGVWSLEYRRTGDAGGGWPGSFEDIEQGLAFIPNLNDSPLDLERVVIVGHSAGGHLALLAGARAENVEAVIGLAAITDIIEYSRGENSCQVVTVDFMGGEFESNPAAYHAANPVDKSLHDHTVLLHGDSDGIVPPQQAQVPVATTVMLEGAGHFDWIHPGTEAYRLLLSTLEEIFQK